MTDTRFDGLTRFLSQPLSRRAVAKRMGVMLGGAALGAFALTSTAGAHAPVQQACARQGQTPGGLYGAACCPQNGLALDPQTGTCEYPVKTSITQVCARAGQAVGGKYGNVCCPKDGLALNTVTGICEYAG